MEKRAGQVRTPLPELIKQADAEERVLVLNMDGYAKYADTGHDKPGILIIATGPRADLLRRVLPDILE